MPRLSTGKFLKLVVQQARIRQIQLEQDSGKTIDDTASRASLIDLNRAGQGLVEIVTEPDFSNGLEAGSFVADLCQTLRSVGACDGKMYEGSLRVDASVSVHRPDEPFGQRTEIKNINSVKSVQEAIDYEIERQRRLVNNGQLINNETRSYDKSCKRTTFLRDKEKIHDYRFMPEPNLPPLRLDQSFVDSIRSELPPTLDWLRNEFVSMGIAPVSVGMLNYHGILDLSHRLIRRCSSVSPTVLLNFCASHFVKYLQMAEIDPADVDFELLCDVCQRIGSGQLSYHQAKCLMLLKKDNPTSQLGQLMEQHQLSLIKDPVYIERICSEVSTELDRYYKRAARGNRTALKKIVDVALKRSGHRIQEKLIVEQFRTMFDDENKSLE